MKNTLLLSFFASFALALALIFTANAFAAGPDNIHGVGGRLESLTCRGAYVMTQSDVEKRLEAAVETACGDISDETVSETCMNNLIRTMARPAPGAVFVGSAVEGQPTFQMQIIDSGSVAFSSKRVGLHGDTAGGTIVLMFERLGVSNDRYTIEGGLMNDEMTRMSSLSVPVRRRILADLNYFFIDGCTMNWANR